MGSVTLEKIILGSPPGTSKAATSISNEKNVSTSARANQLAMARRLDDRSEDMRKKLVKRAATTTSRRDYKRNLEKNKKKNALRPMTREEEERALLQPLEFISKRSANPCCGRIIFTELTGPGAAATRLFKLSDRDLSKIKKGFDAIDEDESGTITQSEFFTCLELIDTPFTRQLCNSIVFEIADSDQNNSLTFDEFCLGVCIVCTLTRDQLLYFVFRCFDVDNSGALSQHEFVAMSLAINEAGGGFFDGNFLQLIDKFDQNGDGQIDFGEFLLVDTFFPMAFFPVFRMQDQLRKNTLGADRWLKIIMIYDAAEKIRCTEESDIRTTIIEQRPFIERMVKLGAMDHIDQGGFTDMRRVSLEGAHKRNSLKLAQMKNGGAMTDRTGDTSTTGNETDRTNMAGSNTDRTNETDGTLEVVEKEEPQKLSVVFEGFEAESNQPARSDLGSLQRAASRGASRGDSKGFKMSLNPNQSFRSTTSFSPTKLSNRQSLHRMTTAPTPYENEKEQREKKKGFLSSIRGAMTGKNRKNRNSANTAKVSNEVEEEYD